MSVEAVMAKARMFKDIEVQKMYTAVAMANEWMKETGGTLDEFLRGVEETCDKKPT